MKTYLFKGLLLATLGVMLLPGQTAAPAQRVYATLQQPGAPKGYVGGSLKVGLETTAGFFIVTGESLRLANADYKIVENTDSPKDNKTYSLQDSKGQFLICSNTGTVTVSATPAANAQWFRIRFYTPAQKTEIENRRLATQNRKAQPGFEAEVN